MGILLGLPPDSIGAGPDATVVSLGLGRGWARLRLDMADPTDITRVIGACLLLTLLGQGLSHLLSRHCPLLPPSIRQAYAGLPRAKRDEWNTRIWSSVHAILVSWLSLHALWAEAPSILENTLHRSAEAPFAIAITTGYLLGDALLVAYSTLPPSLQRRWLRWEYGPISAPVSTLAHHLVGALSFGLSLYFRAGYVLSAMFVATEASTPFINARWHMHEAGWQGSRAYALNGVAMVVVFFLCRVAALPWQAKMVARHVGPLGRAGHWLVSLQCVFSFALILVLNIWWFVKMAQGLARLLAVKATVDPGGKRSGRRNGKEKQKEEGDVVEEDDGPAAAAAATRRRRGKAA